MTLLTHHFPSLRWFKEQAHRTEEPGTAERFRRLGVVDTTFAVVVGDEGYRIVFDGFGCDEVTEWHEDWPVDFVLSAPVETWREVVDGGRSLNSLVLGGDLELTGDEQLGIDCFYRFNPTIESFVELAADLPTEWP